MRTRTIVILIIVTIIVVVAIVVFYVTKPKSNDDTSVIWSRPGTFIDVSTLGGDPSGKTDSSKAVLAAWNVACKLPGKSTIYFPAGQYMISSTIEFSGKQCKKGEINFDVSKATLVAPNYKDLGDVKNWIAFDGVDGVSITGGVFDGQGSGLWECKKSGDDCPDGATSIMFQDSANIELNGVKSVNSQLYHIVFDRCNKVILEGVTITASRDGPNTDGIHVEFSSDVTILHSNVGTGDDCVSVGPGTTRLWIEDMNCGPGHGISIGSLGKDKEEEGVEEVTVKSATFTATQNGVRIKSWARSSNGFVRKVLFQHITMINAQNPIIIDQHYCPRHLNCPHGVSGIQINDVTYQDIHGTSASEVGVTFDCSSKNPCQNIKLDDVDISYDGEKARLICDNVEGLR